jgi:hypothetical protein
MLDLCDSEYFENLVNKVEIRFKNYTCTDFVVKTDGLLKEMNEADDNLVGLEMESYGFMKANEIFLKSGFALFAKSVMDFTDMKKIDRNNEIPIKNNAAYMSYLFSRACIPILIENFDKLCEENGYKSR